MAFSFVLITDHHLPELPEMLARGFSTWQSYLSVLRHIGQHVGDKIDFIVSMGDLCDPPSDAAYSAVMAVLGAETADVSAPGPLRVTCEDLHDIPMYFLPGNHDHLGAMLRVLFPANPPLARMNVAFEHEGVRFVCLDWGREPTADSEGVCEHLADNLQDDMPVVVLTHHAVKDVGAAWLDRFIAPDVARFWETVAGRNVLGVLSGHIHMTTDQLVEGIPVLTTRSTAFQFARQDAPMMVLEPPHYRYVTIDRGVLTSRIYEVNL